MAKVSVLEGQVDFPGVRSNVVRPVQTSQSISSSINKVGTPKELTANFTLFSEEKSGATDRIRTGDPWYHKPVL